MERTIQQRYEALDEHGKMMVHEIGLLILQARNAALEQAASIAGGMTGPGNTLDQSAGYSDACRDIKAAIIKFRGQR